MSLTRPIPTDPNTVLQGRTVRAWLIAAKVFVDAISEQTRTSLEQQLSQVKRGKRTVPELASRLGLFWIASTNPGLRQLPDDSEIFAAIDVCGKLWTPTEMRTTGAINLGGKPTAPLDTTRECGDCTTCRQHDPEFKCAWRQGYDLEHPTKNGVFVVIGPVENGTRQVVIFDLLGDFRTDEQLVKAIVGVVIQLAPTPSRIQVCRRKQAETAKQERKND